MEWAIQQLDNVTPQNSATSEELSATAEELANQAEMLQHTIGFFTTGEFTQKTLVGEERGDGIARQSYVLATSHRIAHIKCAAKAQVGGGNGNGKPVGSVFEIHDFERF